MLAAGFERVDAIVLRAEEDGAGGVDGGGGEDAVAGAEQQYALLPYT